MAHSNRLLQYHAVAGRYGIQEHLHHGKFGDSHTAPGHVLTFVLVQGRNHRIRLERFIVRYGANWSKAASIECRAILERRRKGKSQRIEPLSISCTHI